MPVMVDKSHSSIATYIPYLSVEQSPSEQEDTACSSSVLDFGENTGPVAGVVGARVVIRMVVGTVVHAVAAIDPREYKNISSWLADE